MNSLLAVNRGRYELALALIVKVADMDLNLLVLDSRYFCFLLFKSVR